MATWRIKTIQLEGPTKPIHLPTGTVLENRHLRSGSWVSFVLLQLESRSCQPGSILVNENSSYTLLPLHFKDYVSPTLPLKCSSRRIVRQEPEKPDYHMSAILLFQILGSFSSMMLRPETLPPFIHPTFHPENFSSIEINNAGVFEALSNCISISQLFQSRTKENSRFVWGSIRQEHERIWHNVSFSI